MARRNISLNIDGQIFNSAVLTDFSSLTDNNNAYLQIYTGETLPSWVKSLGDVIFPSDTVIEHLADETQWGYQPQYYARRNSSNKIYYHLWLPAYRRNSGGQSVGSLEANSTGFNDLQNCYISFVVDDEQEKGWIVLIYERASSYVVAQVYDGNMYYRFGTEITAIANGGGATTITTVSGMLNEIASNSTNRYKIIAMSGGGGGGMIKGGVLPGNNSGGWKGSGNNSSNINSGYTWGYGETGTGVSAGGAGYRGAYKATVSEGGGGGCANMALFNNGTRWNKKMVGYDVPTTTGDNYTESTDQASENAESNKAKIGDGRARISYVSDLPRKSQVMPSGSTEVELVYQSLQSNWVAKTLDEILVLIKSITMASGNQANAFFYIPYSYNTGGGYVMPMYVSSRTNLYTLTEESLMYDDGQDYTFVSGQRIIGINNADIVDQNDVCGSYCLNAQKTALTRLGSNSVVEITRNNKTYQVSPPNYILGVESTMTYMFYTDASITNIYVDGVKQ